MDEFGKCKFLNKKNIEWGLILVVLLKFIIVLSEDRLYCMRVVEKVIKRKM